jgi:transcriptional regulator with XRE-family HTH domain
MEEIKKNTIDQNFATAVRTKMAFLHVKQRDVAACAGINRALLSNIATGRVRATPSVKEKLCQILGIHPQTYASVPIVTGISRKVRALLEERGVAEENLIAAAEKLIVESLSDPDRDSGYALLHGHLLTTEEWKVAEHELPDVIAYATRSYLGDL